MLPYPVDSPGYVEFPGTVGNYLQAPDDAALDITGNLTIVAHILPDSWASPVTQNIVGKWLSTGNQRSYRMLLYPTGQVGGNWSSSGASAAVQHAEPVGGVAGVPLWVAWTLVTNEGGTRYSQLWKSSDGVAWTKLRVAPLSGGAITVFSGTGPVEIGSINNGVNEPFAGKIYHVSIRSGVSGTGATATPGGIEVFRFDATKDLSGVPSTATSFKPSVGPVMTVNRKATAADQGYIKLPGTVGNYMSTPDTATLDITTDLNITARVRATDTSPVRIGMGIVGKGASYSLTVTPEGLLFNSGASNATQTFDPPLPNNTWIWYRVWVHSSTVNFKYSLADTLTPPTTWTNAGTVAGPATTVAGADAVFIGATAATVVGFEGDIGYFRIAGGDPDGTNTVALLLSADEFVGVSPDATTLTGATGKTVTITRTPTPKNTGYVWFPGTVGNFLEMPDAAALDLTGSFSLIARITPERWNDDEDQTILSKWGAAGQRSYAWKLAPAGRMRFSYSVDGTAVVDMPLSDEVPHPGTDRALWVGLATWTSNNERWVRYVWSIDNVDWTRCGVVSYVGAAPQSIFNSTEKLLIGQLGPSTPPATSIKQYPFHGRIWSVAGFSGANLMLGNVSTVTDYFRIDSRHLAIAAEATSFPATGGTVTVKRKATPVDFGVWYFPGTRGNYLQVPDAANLRITDNLVADVRVVPDDWTPKYYDRLLIGKSGAAGNVGWKFLLTPTGRLKLQWSTDGTVLKSVESTIPVPLADYYAKRVAFSYSSLTTMVCFWIGDDGETWTPLGAPVNPSGTIFASTAPVQLGVEYQGAMTNASIRNQVAADGRPVLGTEVFLMDQSCLNLDPSVPSFPATSGQTVTVVRDDASIEYGELVFPGTKGNYLETPDHASLDITGSFTVLLRLAPNDWNPPTGQTLISKWVATGNQRSFYISLSAGTTTTFTFTWTGNGDIAQAQSLTTPALIDFIDTEYRFVALTIEMGATKTLRMFETRNDGDTWIPIGAAATTAFGSNTIHSGTAPLQIAAVADTAHYAGRLSYVSIRSGIGTGGVPGGTEVFRIDQETLHIPPQSTDFNEVTGKNVVIYQEPTPAEAGYVNFYGVAGEFMRTLVPTFDTTADFTITTRLDLADTREEQNYLTPTIGAAALLDGTKAHLTEDVFISALVTLVAGNEQYIAAVWSPSVAVSWAWYIGTTGGMRFAWSEDGSSAGWEAPLDLVTKAQLAALGGYPVYLGLQIEFDVLGESILTAMSSENGVDWEPLGTPRTAPVIISTYDSDFPLTIGGTSSGPPPEAGKVPTFTKRWRGDIQWVQMHRLPDETLVWRFDADEWSTGVEWTDDRENKWGLEKEGAITLSPPPATSSDQIVVQKWDEDPIVTVTNKVLTTNVATLTTKELHKLNAGDKVEVAGVGAPFDGPFTVVSVPTTKTFTYAKTNANVASAVATGTVTHLGRSFSLRRTPSGFKLHISQDGKTVGMTADIAVANTAWPSNVADPEHRWGWFAVTAQFTAAGVELHSFISEDLRSSIGTPLAPVWQEHGTGQASPAITAMYTGTEQITIGATEKGSNPFIGSIAALTLNEGVGTAGVPGGTEVFAFGMDALFELAPDTPSFTAKTGQVVTMAPASTSRLMYIEMTKPGPIVYLDPSPPGPPLSLLPAPVGPTTTITPSSPGSVAVIVPSNPGPSLDIVGPSLDRPWWPGSQDDDTSKWWQQPAFTVQRTIEGVIKGGDYVRGSTNALTEQTALRFPRYTSGLTPIGPGGGILFTKPYDYETIQIEWNVPQQLVMGEGASRDPWLEVVIVRSAFGNPSTVNDGQTIFRMTKDGLYPTGEYTTDRDGNILTPDVFDPRVPEQSGDEPGLPNGRWYYYGLFFKVGTHWIRTMVHHTLLPRNHHHDEHLWNALPPYYRYLDNEQRGQAGPGDLQQFLKLFGFSFDLTKEYVESWLDLYHTDFTPMTLLRNVGENVGSPYEPGIGDIRYRALIARIGYLYQGRGTAGALRQLIAATSKCDCDVVPSPNIFLLPDDADFFQGTGNWVGMHPDTKPSGAGIPAAPLDPKKVHLDHGIFARPAPNATTGGRGSMHVWTAVADATADIVVTCGDGLQYLWDRKATINPTDDVLVSDIAKELLPRVNGIYVQPDNIFGFSIWCRTDAVGARFLPMVMYFDRDGLPTTLLDRELGGVQTIPANTTTWYQASLSGPVPANARYAVPAVIITNRPAGADPTYPGFSRMVHFAGASCHILGTVAQVASVDPDRYLTLSGPTSQDARGEEIGPPREDPAFPGYLLGDDIT